MPLKITQNSATKQFIGGEIIKFKNNQVKRIYVQQGGTSKLVWQYDNNAPTLTYWPTSNPYWSYDNVAVTASASDSQSGLKSLTIGGWSTTSRTYTPTTSKQSIPIVATDNAGNVNTQYAYIQSPTVPSGFSLTSTGWASANGGQGYSSVTGSATYLKTNTVSGTVNGFQHTNTDSMEGRMRIQKGYNTFYVGFYNYYTRDDDDGGGPVPSINSSYPLTVEVWDCWGNKTATLGTASYQVRGTTALTLNVSAYNDGLHFIKTYAKFWGWGYSWTSSSCFLEMKLY